MTSWTELLQKEINLIEDIKVWIVRRSSSRVPFFNKLLIQVNVLKYQY